MQRCFRELKTNLGRFPGCKKNMLAATHISESHLASVMALKKVQSKNNHLLGGEKEYLFALVFLMVCYHKPSDLRF